MVVAILSKALNFDYQSVAFNRELWCCNGCSGGKALATILILEGKLLLAIYKTKLQKAVLKNKMKPETKCGNNNNKIPESIAEDLAGAI